MSDFAFDHALSVHNRVEKIHSICTWIKPNVIVKQPHPKWCETYDESMVPFISGINKCFIRITPFSKTRHEYSQSCSQNRGRGLNTNSEIQKNVVRIFIRFQSQKNSVEFAGVKIRRCLDFCVWKFHLSVLCSFIDTFPHLCNNIPRYTMLSPYIFATSSPYWIWLKHQIMRILSYGKTRTEAQGTSDIIHI